MVTMGTFWLEAYDTPHCQMGKVGEVPSELHACSCPQHRVHSSGLENWVLANCIIVRIWPGVPAVLRQSLDIFTFRFWSFQWIWWWDCFNGFLFHYKTYFLGPLFKICQQIFTCSRSIGICLVLWCGGAKSRHNDFFIVCKKELQSNLKVLSNQTYHQNLPLKEADVCSTFSCFLFDEHKLPYTSKDGRRLSLSTLMSCSKIQTKLNCPDAQT